MVKTEEVDINKMDRKPSQNDQNEHGMGKDCAKSRQSPKWQSRGQYEESAVNRPELRNTIECNLNPSDGPGKPNSIIMKTVKTKWALNQLQTAHLCAIDKDCKDFEGPSSCPSLPTFSAIVHSKPTS
ncbi:hypothetical protein Tco_0862820 [Tanacetum coccineum]